MIRLDLDWSEQTSNIESGVTNTTCRSLRVDETNAHCRPIPIRVKFGMFFTLLFTSLVTFGGFTESNSTTDVKLGSVHGSNFNDIDNSSSVSPKVDIHLYKPLSRVV